MLNNTHIEPSAEPETKNHNLLLYAVNDPLFIIDKEKKIIFINGALSKTYGFSNEELLYKDYTALVGCEETKKLNDIFKISANEIWNVQLKQRKKEGEYFHSLVKAFRYYYDDEDQFVFIIHPLQDINKPKDTVELFKDKFITLFYEIKDVIYESTPDGKLLDINPAGIELFGYDTKKELLNVDVADHLYVNPADRNNFKERLEDFGYVKDYEIEIKKKNGNVLTVLETAFSVKDNRGNVIAYRGILRDITEIKSNQKKLRKYLDELAEVNKQLVFSEKELQNMNAAKDKFFSIVAHDLRSPFTSLIGYSEFLKEDLDVLSQEEIRTFASNINESSKIVFTLLENLLQWSRIQTGRIVIEPIVFDISILANQAVKLLQNNASNKSINLSNNIAKRTFVHADEQTVSSVIQNLVSNAIKFTNTNGIINIEGSKQKDQVTISVTDNGVGINRPDLEKLFRIDNHHTTTGTNNETGSGLGLILCKELIEKNKGKIWVESEPGHGSKFSFTLPIHA